MQTFSVPFCNCNCIAWELLYINRTNILSKTIKQIEEIKQKATYIFANRRNMEEHNREQLKQQHSTKNPIARLLATTSSRGKQYRGRAKCMKNESSVEPILNICRGARVQISGKNFEPDWGLYNGAVGTVVEIVFNENENPLDGTLPQYILVDFPQYRGPSWISEKPTWIPIPSIEMNCSNYCCQFMFVPLSLAYSKTGHTFQGQTCGPGHPIPCIIVQPGTIKMERTCPGLLYMFLSRATTIGTPEDRSTSAIFFFTNELTKKRIQNLTTTMSGEICKKIARRSKWVQLLNKNKLKIKISKKQKEDLISWAKGTTVSQNIVHKIIEDTSWRKSNSLNF